jgi:periplasmic protein TonB
MFVESLLDSTWANRSHRGWTALISLAVQALGVGVLLLLPFIYTQGLPELRLMRALPASPAPPPGPPPSAAHQRSSPPISASNMIGERLLSPDRIPSVIARVSEPNALPPLNPAGGTWIPGGIGEGSGSVLNSIANVTHAVVPPPPAIHKLRVSRMMEGNLIHKVQPDYPPVARAARIQGPVVLRAIIGKDGGIANLRVLSGHPVLVKAAMDAVSQWRYRPYSLNGEPVEVETQITVNFVLAGG